MKGLRHRRDSSSKATRVSVSIPSGHYNELSKIANTKRVSIAWVVRAAVEQYLSAKAPLFPPAK